MSSRENNILDNLKVVTVVEFRCLGRGSGRAGGGGANGKRKTAVSKSVRKWKFLERAVCENT